MDTTTIAHPSAANLDLFPSLLKSLVMLGLVLAILLLFLFIIRRLFQAQGNPASRGVIKMLASFYLSPKEKILLIQVLQERFLIGVTPTQINFLTKIESDNELPEQTKSEPNSFFINILKGAVKKSKPDKYRTDPEIDPNGSNDST